MGYNKFAADVCSVKRIENGEFKLIINSIDFEIEIANNDGIIDGFTKDTLHNYTPIKLLPRRRYYFRYNNNDGSEGALDIEVRLYDQYGDSEIVWHRRDYTISGPFVIEDKILFHEEGEERNRIV